MPRRWSRSGPALSIQLDTANSSFHPGDTITGRVIRQLPPDTSRALLTIRLCGRDKVKLRVQEYLLPTPFRSSTNLLGDGSHHAIYDGPLHIPDHTHTGQPPFSCPFSLTLPSHDAISGKALPATFYTRSRIPTSTLRAYVDYWIEASLSNRASPSARDMAICPLVVTLPRLPIIILPPSSRREHKTQYLRWTATHTVSNQYLLPGMENHHPARRTAISNAVYRVLASHSTVATATTKSSPRYTFQIEITTQRTIQLNVPSPVAFYIRTLPVPGQSSPVLAQRSRLIELRSIQIKLVARTTAVLQGKGRARGRKKRSYYKKPKETEKVCPVATRRCSKRDGPQQRGRRYGYPVVVMMAVRVIR